MMSSIISGIMDVELLGEDELLVELEVRGVKDPRITPKLKSALSKRLKQEKVESFTTLQWQHKAARERPEQEFATCKSKMWAVQQYLLRNIFSGVAVNEMLRWVDTKMRHVEGRINRAEECDAFGEKAEKLYEIRNFLWEMMFLLEEGLTPPYEVAEKLSRLKIKIDKPRGDPEKVVYEEVKVENSATEVEVEKVEEEQFEEDEVVEEPEEDQFSPLENQPEAVVSKPNNEEEEAIVVNEVVKEEDEGKTADEAMAVPSGGVVYPDKGCITVSVRSHTKSAGSSKSKARDSRKRERRDGSANVHSKSARCARIVADVCAGIERYAAYVQKPVDRLLGVLDLRLEDDVLARANRQVFREDASGFPFC